MRIRRFTANDMTEALRLVRESLGPEAVILEAKGVPEGRGPRTGVTVMAAVDRHPETRLEQPPAFGVRENERDTQGAGPVRRIDVRSSGLIEEPARLPARATTGAPTLGDTDVLPGLPRRETGHAGPLEQEIKRLQARVFYLNRLITSDHFSAIPIPLRELYLDLLEADLDSNLAFAILRDIAERTTTDIVSGARVQPLRDRLLKVVPRGESIPQRAGRRVAIFVGPPGAGKSLTVTSLAAQSLRAGRRPGIISLDSFRPGGSSGLEHYAHILDVPFLSVLEPQDLATAGDSRMGEADLLLVDTPGISLSEREAVSLVRRFQLQFVEPEVHGVLDATSRVRDAAQALDLLRHFQLVSLIFTKLDLASRYGGILSLSLKTRVPVIHCGWGQRVLADLKPCDPETLVDLVLERCTRGWETPARASDEPGLKEAVR
jgi:flagellar biosynthesis protein FlhF